MAITPKTGKVLKKNSVRKDAFLNLINTENNIKLVLRGTKILVEERVLINPSGLRFSNLHRDMSDEARNKFFKGSIKKRKIIAVGSDIEDKDWLLNKEPLIDWSNTLSMYYVKLKENKRSIIDTAASFDAMFDKDKEELININEPIEMIEYLVISDHSVIGIYNGEG